MSHRRLKATSGLIFCRGDWQNKDGKQKKKPPVRRKRKPAKVVEELLTQVEKRLGDGEIKATLGDYIRLVQLRKELDEDEPKNIEVRWVEPEGGE